MRLFCPDFLQTHLLFSGIEWMCACVRACVNMISNVRWGPSFSLSRQARVPVKRRCCLRQSIRYTGFVFELKHPAWDISQGCSYARTRVTRRHIFISGVIPTPFFLLAASPGWRVGDEQPEALEFNCVNSLSCIISGFLRWFETTHLKFPIMCAIALFKCHRQHVCQGPWTDALHY